MADDVTVIIPAYKAEMTIERAVRSVLGQSGVEARVIVVIDDQSTETRDIVEQIGSDRVEVMANERNSGAPYSRNVGLRRCRTSFVLFLDSDDYLTGDLLSGLAQVLSGSDLDMAFGPWIRMDERVNMCERFTPSYTSAEDALRRWMIDKAFTPPCSLMWRTASIRRFGGWDEELRRNQDGELALRALLLGARFGFSQRGAGVYWKHASEHRITGSGRNYRSLLTVACKLGHIHGFAVSTSAKSSILGAYLYKVAVMAFEADQVDIGREALGLSRSFGYAGHRGNRRARFGSAVLGLERYHRIFGRARLRARG